jgi:hypothetical protein
MSAANALDAESIAAAIALPTKIFFMRLLLKMKRPET